VLLSDGDDYDNDNRVGPVELCATSATNSDPDGDLTSGSCDAAPASLDNDGDGNGSTDYCTPVADCVADADTCETTGNGICDNDVDGDNWINNTDNCSTTANADQSDDDGDGVGDVCDVFDTVDTFSNLPAGKGDGAVLPASVANLDNDLLCSDPYNTGTAEAFGDGDIAGDCSRYTDTDDDGISDLVDPGSDEDGDGASDGCEYWANRLAGGASGSALHPGITPYGASAYCNGNADFDAWTNGCEEATPGNPVGDTDGDCVSDTLETKVGTSTVSPGPYLYDGTDTDGDGCADIVEVSSLTTAGGRRHPGNYWDFYDVTGDGRADLSDALATLSLFGQPASNPAVQPYDRAKITSPPAGFEHVTIESNTGIDLSDVLNALEQFGDECGPYPGPAPAPGGGLY
jgi:hypothetical protein